VSGGNPTHERTTEINRTLRTLSLVLSGIGLAAVAVFASGAAPASAASCTTMQLGGGMTTTNCSNGYSGSTMDLGGGMTSSTISGPNGLYGSGTDLNLGGGMTSHNGYVTGPAGYGSYSGSTMDLGGGMSTTTINSYGPYGY
jgi:hypothetical protein